MDSERIEQLLKQADHPKGTESDPSDVADRVLRTIRRRRITRTAMSLLLLVGLLGVIMTNLPQTSPSPEIALHPKPQLELRVEGELAAIEAEIAIREALVSRLESIERRMEISARLAALAGEPREEQIIERAAAAVVFQADRMRVEGDNPQAAERAYHEVIAYFPQATSARLARQRIAQFDKAG